MKSDPDGYTLLYHSTTGIVHAAVTKKLPYDWMRDLAPVAIVTRFAPVMVISPTLPAKNLKEFIALLKANPGKYSYASSGTGTALHLGVEIVQAEGRRRHRACALSRHGRGDAGPAVRPHRHDARWRAGADAEHQSGTLPAVAVTTGRRSPAIPDVPTMIESGLDDEVPFWTAIYAPATTPKPIIEKLNAAIAKAMKDDGVIKRLADVGTEAVGSTAAELDTLTRQQFDLYREIVPAIRRWLRANKRLH